MGRPLKTAKVVQSTTKEGIIGASATAGQQLVMSAFITGALAAADTTEVDQKGTKRFRCTNGDGTEVLSLVPAAALSLVAGQCSLLLTDSALGTYYASKLTQNYVTIGAVDTGTQFAVGDRVLWVDDQTAATENVTVQVNTA